ncbi:hypothetical protein U9M48_001876 [Paspalum notatum var. saurae]|uniref:F-box domain-containing protein n=1 Tax=Paspalum notatum var. saurae TaxID=547442 RepID=A0AAQ3SIM6_PASNO
MLGAGQTMEIDEAASERARASGAGSSAVDVDRLSALPDCLLHAIVSSLKARQVVQTCVLSKRWMNLWRSVPCLDVDLDEFKAAARASNGNQNINNNNNDDDNNAGSDSDNSDSDLSSFESDLESADSNEDKSTKDKEWEDFEDFSVSLMHRCNIARLDSFRLAVRRDRAPLFGDRQAGGWLRRAMKYCTPDPPSEGLRSNSWHLKRMYLCNVLLDTRFSEHVGSVCRALQVLELDDCTCKIQSITSGSLKTLVLKNCRWQTLTEIRSPTLKSLVIKGGSNNSECVLVIAVPAIVQLCLDVPASSGPAQQRVLLLRLLALCSSSSKAEGFLRRSAAAAPPFSPAASPPPGSSRLERSPGRLRLRCSELR